VIHNEAAADAAAFLQNCHTWLPTASAWRARRIAFTCKTSTAWSLLCLAECPL